MRTRPIGVTRGFAQRLSKGSVLICILIKGRKLTIFLKWHRIQLKRRMCLRLACWLLHLLPRQGRPPCFEHFLPLNLPTFLPTFPIQLSQSLHRSSILCSRFQCSHHSPSLPRPPPQTPRTVLVPGLHRLLAHNLLFRPSLRTTSHLRRFRYLLANLIRRVRLLASCL